MIPALSTPVTDVAHATFAGVTARRPVECVDLLEHPEALISGWWAVVATFEGAVTGWRFEDVEHHGPSSLGVTMATHPGDPRVAPWQGPGPGTWTSSLSEDEYLAAVTATREAIREGQVYQANICRVLSAPLRAPGEAEEPSATALARILAADNPAPYAGSIHVPASSGLPPAWVVSASPELFLSVRGDRVLTGPIKGTGATAGDLQEKDHAENVMITDLMRNDLQRVSRPGSVEVVDLCAVEKHPGLVHLVSRVAGSLRTSGTPGAWRALLEATLPPGSVSGAPKSSALRLIEELETAPRGPYCGAVGWIDADAGRAELAVGIRTFWWSRDEVPGTGTLRFGTGAGITWGSDPATEWRETQLKAARLVSLASGVPVTDSVPVTDWTPVTDRVPVGDDPADTGRGRLLP